MAGNCLSNHHPLRFAAAVAIFAAVSAVAGAVTPEADNGTTDFIRSNCGATLYPDLCYTTLSAYAAAVQTNPATLARVAVYVALHRSARVSLLARRAAGQSPALSDCAALLSDSSYQMRRSASELHRASGSRVDDGGFKTAVGNAETWMSAALTDQETCTDGLTEFEPTSAAAADAAGEICRRLSDVKEVTSNALALVTKFAATGGAR